MLAGVATAVGVGPCCVLGLIAGYVGGRVNLVIMRTFDVFYAFPSVLLAVAISGALGPVFVYSTGLISVSMIVGASQPPVGTRPFI